MRSDARIFVAGGRTMIGRAILRRLVAAGFQPVAADDEPEPGDLASVEHFFDRHRPEYVFVAAGQTAGIGGNVARPADLMTDNLLVAAHLIPTAARQKVTKLLYLASSCVYPKQSRYPLQTSALWAGPLEPTSSAYATAKLAGVALCDAYRQQHGLAFVSGIAADAYGPGDDFSPDNSHVVGALLRRFDEAAATGAASVDVWGSGKPRREFIYVDDLADAAIFAMNMYDGAAPINLGTGIDTSIADLAREIAAVVGYRGSIHFDSSRPDGMPYKGLDSSLLRGLGWSPSWTLRQGLQETCRWYREAEKLRSAGAREVGN